MPSPPAFEAHFCAAAYMPNEWRHCVAGLQESLRDADVLDARPCITCLVCCARRFVESLATAVQMTGSSMSSPQPSHFLARRRPLRACVAADLARQRHVYRRHWRRIRTSHRLLAREAFPFLLQLIRAIFVCVKVTKPRLGLKGCTRLAARCHGCNALTELS